MPGFSIDWINQNIAKYGGVATLINGERVPVLFDVVLAFEEAALCWVVGHIDVFLFLPI